MVKNYFYLIAGLLCIVFAVTHTLNGTSTVLPVLDEVGMEDGIKTSFTYVWHIIGVENLVMGIALLVMAFQRNPSRVTFTAYLFIAILAVRWLTIAAFTLLNDSDSATQLLPDTIAILVTVGLLLFGTRVKPRISKQ